MKSDTRTRIKHAVQGAWEKTRRNLGIIGDRFNSLKSKFRTLKRQPEKPLVRPSFVRKTSFGQPSARQPSVRQTSFGQPSARKTETMRQPSGRETMRQPTQISNSEKRKETNQNKLMTIANFYEVGQLINIGKRKKHLFDAKITINDNNNSNTPIVYFIPIITEDTTEGFDISANISAKNILSDDLQKQVDTDSLIMNLLNNFTLTSFFRNDEKCFMERLSTNANTKTSNLRNNVIQLSTLKDLKQKLATDKATKKSKTDNCSTMNQFVYTLVFQFNENTSKTLYVPILVSYPTNADNESEAVSYSLITDVSRIPDDVHVNDDANVKKLNNIEDWLDYALYESYVGGGKMRHKPTKQIRGKNYKRTHKKHRR